MNKLSKYYIFYQSLKVNVASKIVEIITIQEELFCKSCETNMLKITFDHIKNIHFTNII